MLALCQGDLREPNGTFSVTLNQNKPSGVAAGGHGGERHVEEPVRDEQTPRSAATATGPFASASRARRPC